MRIILHQLMGLLWRRGVLLSTNCILKRRRDDTDVQILDSSSSGMGENTYIMNCIKANSSDVTGSFDNEYFVRMNIVAILMWGIKQSSGGACCSCCAYWILCCCSAVLLGFWLAALIKRVPFPASRGGLFFAKF